MKSDWQHDWYRDWQRDQRRVGAAAAVVVPTVLVVSVVFAWLFSPIFANPFRALLQLHYLGIAGLGLFLTYAGYCQWQAERLKSRPRADPRMISQTYRNWWAATMIAPPAAAFCILASGFRLVFVEPNSSVLALPWLFWLVLSFGFFFFDGLLFYLPELCCRYKAVASSDPIAMPVEPHSGFGRWSGAMLALHALSFPLVLVLGWCRPMTPAIPELLIEPLLRLGDADTSPAALRVIQVATMLLLEGVVITAIRWSGLTAQLRFLRRAKP